MKNKIHLFDHEKKLIHNMATWIAKHNKDVDDYLLHASILFLISYGYDTKEAEQIGYRLSLQLQNEENLVVV